mgnify:FL=1
MKRALTMYYDDDFIQLVKVDIASVFENEDTLSRADILKDCVAYITELYNGTVAELNDPQIPLSEKCGVEFIED